MRAKKGIVVFELDFTLFEILIEKITQLERKCKVVWNGRHTLMGFGSGQANTLWGDGLDIFWKREIKFFEDNLFSRTNSNETYIADV